MLIMTATKKKDSGCLYVVATPIGHMDDMTYRAVEVLKRCDLILCEDTRHSKRLLQHYGIDTHTRSLHVHNEHRVSTSFIADLKAGQHIALISDAGTPLISDPGFTLIAMARSEHLTVQPIPGASAVIALLSAAGLPVQPFTFHGFIPPKKNQRIEFYQQLMPLNHTHVFYESSHRIAQSLDDLNSVLDDQAQVCVGRELTKRFEQFYSGNAQQVCEEIRSGEQHQKGEFVVAIYGQARGTSQLDDNSRQLGRQLQPLLPPKQAAKVVAEHYGLNKKQVYEYLISSADD